MKGIDTMKKLAFFSFVLMWDIWRKPLIALAKSAKILCKAFSYGAIPDPFLDLRSSKMDQIKVVDVFQKWKIADTYLFFDGINIFHMIHLRASEVKERIKNDTIAKKFTWYFS